MQADTPSVRKVEVDTGTVTTLALDAKTVPPLGNPAGLLCEPVRDLRRLGYVSPATMAGCS